MSLRFVTQIENACQKYFDYFIKEKINNFKIFFNTEIQSILDEYNYDEFEQVEELENHNRILNNIDLINNFNSFESFQDQLKDNDNSLYAYILLFISKEIKEKKLIIINNKEEIYYLTLWITNEIKSISSSNIDIDTDIFFQDYDDVYDKILSKYENEIFMPEIINQVKKFKWLEINDRYCIEDVIDFLIEKYKHNLPTNLIIWFHEWLIPFIEYHLHFVYFIDKLFQNNLLNEEVFQISETRDILFNIPVCSYIGTISKGYDPKAFNKKLYKYITNKKEQIEKERKEVQQVKLPIVNDIVNYIIVKYI
jgi:hypothetical protein